jgi:hypothetical protein
MLFEADFSMRSISRIQQNNNDILITFIILQVTVIINLKKLVTSVDANLRYHSDGPHVPSSRDGTSTSKFSTAC